jgi:hypothetical protein
VSPSWTIPYHLMDVIRESVGPPTVCSPRHMRGRRHKGEVGPGLTLWPRHELWPLMLPPWLTCVVLSGYTLARLVIDSNLHDTLRLG